jgi:hypothetical protein
VICGFQRAFPNAVVKYLRLNGCKVRVLILDRVVSAATRLNVRISRHAAAQQLTPLQQFPRSERRLQENQIHSSGSLPPLDRSQHFRIRGEPSLTWTARSGHW